MDELKQELSVRRRCKRVDYFYELLKANLDWIMDEEETVRAVRYLERACYKKTRSDAMKESPIITCNWNEPAFQLLYDIAGGRIISLLDHKSSGYSRAIVDTLMSCKKKDDYMFIFDDLYTLKPELKEYVEATRAKHAGTPSVATRVITCYKCPACGAKETTIRSAQTRRADEAATVTVLCTKCPATWEEH